MGRAPKSKKLKPPSSDEEAQSKSVCFTIMPFGGRFDIFYEKIYKPAIEAAGLNPQRADALYRPGTIVNDIWMLTKKAKLVLVELSDKNPNVFYELGLAHALAKPAILVTQTMDDVPFDLRGLRVIVYDRDNPDWGVDLKRRLQFSIKELLVSPLESVLPSFLQVDDSHKPSVSTTEKELIALRQEVYQIKRDQFSLREQLRNQFPMNPPAAPSYLAESRRIGGSIGGLISFPPTAQKMYATEEDSGTRASDQIDVAPTELT